VGDTVSSLEPVLATDSLDTSGDDDPGDQEN
jgi:hypothetical protein